MTCKYHKYKYCPNSCYNNGTRCHFASDCHINIENKTTLGQASDEPIADTKLLGNGTQAVELDTVSEKPVSDPLGKRTDDGNRFWCIDHLRFGRDAKCKDQCDVCKN